MAIDPSRPFAATAAFYRHRAAYAPAALNFIAATFALDGAARVLDLGCGPGTLSIPLAAVAGEVVAVDPEPEMLAQGRVDASAAGRGNIAWVQARAEDLPNHLGPFRVATLGQSFHWMDRDAVLRRLGEEIAQGGGLALVNPGPRRPQESWEPIADAVVERFLGPRAHPAREEPEHTPALRRSRHFSVFESHVFGGELTRQVAEIVAAVFSLSYASRPRFGQEVDAFEAALTDALFSANPSGTFRERVETEVLVSFRAG